MDISSIVNYDLAFPVKIKHPGTLEEVGITFNIVSFDSNRVQSVEAAISNERLIEAFSADDKRLSPEKLAFFAAKERRETLIAAIDGWEWGDHTFGDLGQSPECSEANRRYVVEHPNAAWILAQIESAARGLGNFMPESKKPARRGSK